MTEYEQAINLIREGNRRIYPQPKYFFEFCNEVVSYGLPKEMNSIREKPHRELCEFVTKWKKRKKLILLPRGSLKSTLVTQALSIWEIIKNPNIRILIASENLGNAIKYLGYIKGQFESNIKLKEIFGDYVSKTGWTEESILVSKRTLNLREPTVSTAGVEMTRVGMHYDLIIVDDPMSHNNTQTKESIAKVIDWYRGLLSILEPTGRLIVIGTRWHDADLYGHIIEEEEEIANANGQGEFDTMVRKAIQDDGTLFFPDILNKEFLDSQMRTQTPYFFSMQYQNDPIPQDTAVFKKDYLVYYDSDSIKGKNLNVFMAIDPAISEVETADYSAIVVVGVDEFNQLYILDVDRGHWKPSELISKIFQYDETYNPKEIALETVAFQKSLQYSLQDEMKKRGYFLPIRELRPGPDKSKEIRIQSLEPRYRNKAVLHPKSSFRPKIVYLEDELLRFPRGKHDDLIDALTMNLEIISPASKRRRKNDDKKEKLKYKPRYSSTGY